MKNIILLAASEAFLGARERFFGNREHFVMPGSVSWLPTIDARMVVLVHGFFWTDLATSYDWICFQRGMQKIGCASFLVTSTI